MSFVKLTASVVSACYGNILRVFGLHGKAVVFLSLYEIWARWLQEKPTGRNRFQGVKLLGGRVLGKAEPSLTFFLYSNLTYFTSMTPSSVLALASGS